MRQSQSTHRRVSRLTPNILRPVTRAAQSDGSDAGGGPVVPSSRYELGDLIATGGLGEVYRAWDRQLQRKVAIKRILAQGPVQGEAYNRALTEATHLAALQHPHIVSVYDFGLDDRGPYVVMELVEGETLEAVATRAAFPQEDFIRLAREALEALSAAHAIGLLHRDLKPGNIMLKWGSSGGFQVKLLDFGLAKISRKPTLQTRLHDNTVLGSIHFMAPEQFEGRPFDHRVDLYALGCVFYYALTQQNPFQGDTVAAVINAHLSHQCTPLGSLRPDLPADLCAWANRFCALRADDRPATAAGALEELVRITAPKPPPTEPAPVAPPPPPVRTNIIVPAFVVGVLLTAIWFWLIQPRLSRPDPAPDQPAIRTTPAPNVPEVEPPAVGDIIRPADAQKPLEAGDLAGVRERLGQIVRVEGIVTAASANRKGDVRYLSFGPDQRTSLSLVFPQADVRKDCPPDLLRTFVGKRVRAEGTAVEREGALGVLIENIKQVEAR